MPKSDNQKLKILYILDYLERNSHENHYVNAAELIRMLQNHGISCDRKTVYSDVAALQDYGVDIVSEPGKNGGYYIASRNFEPHELKLLIDAVQSSRFLTEKKSQELIQKLCAECNEQDAKLLTLRYGLEGGSPQTPQQVAAKLGIPVSQVAEREAQILQKLRSNN